MKYEFMVKMLRGMYVEVDAEDEYEAKEKMTDAIDGQRGMFVTMLDAEPELIYWDFNGRASDDCEYAFKVI